MIRYQKVLIEFRNKSTYILLFKEVKIDDGGAEDDIARCTPVDEVKEIPSDNEETEEDESVRGPDVRPVTAPAGSIASPTVDQKNEKYFHIYI